MFSNFIYKERGQLKIYNRIVRSSFALPDAESLTLLFVLDRTVGYQKVWAAISIKEFQSGAFRTKRGDHILVTPGTGLPAEQVILAIDALCESGAIETESNASTVFYRINENWLHPALPHVGPLAIWGLNEGDYEYRSKQGEDD